MNEGYAVFILNATTQVPIACFLAKVQAKEWANTFYLDNYKLVYFKCEKVIWNKHEALSD